MDKEMEKLQYALEAELSDEYYGQVLPMSEFGPFSLDYDDEGVHWVSENGNYLIDIELFKGNNFVMGITLFKAVEPGESGEYSIGEWKDLKHKEIPIDPSILRGHMEDIKDRYILELKKFIKELGIEY